MNISTTYVHIFNEYKAKMAESIEHDNQTKRVCKLACKRASADCSAVARRMRALCVAPSGNACTASEYNFSFVDFHTKNAPIFGAFFIISSMDWGAIKSVCGRINPLSPMKSLSRWDPTSSGWHISFNPRIYHRRWFHFAFYAAIFTFCRFYGII